MWWSEPSRPPSSLPTGRNPESTVFSRVPGKDLVLLEISPGGRKLPTLHIAEVAPAKGAKVYAFGAPLGLSGSVSDGLVAKPSPRRGDAQITGDEFYVRVMRYDLDADWIQTTAPISHGNSGGPLVNVQGEVVAVNTWGPQIGQNLNFAVWRSTSET